jgi:hypothetical protein
MFDQHDSLAAIEARGAERSARLAELNARTKASLARMKGYDSHEEMVADEAALKRRAAFVVLDGGRSNDAE